MNGEPMEWVGEITHLGNILSSNLSDKNDVIYKKGQFIGNVNRIIAQFGYTQLPVKCKLFNSYRALYFMVVLYGTYLLLTFHHFVLPGIRQLEYCVIYHIALTTICKYIIYARPTYSTFY